MLATLLAFLERIVGAWFGSRERDARQYDKGASEQRDASLRAAEREEEIARAAGEVAEAAIDDPRDLRKD